MSFIQALSDFLESIFMKSSPEVQKKQQQKKLEAELKNFTPLLYKDGKLVPNFAEAIYSLYKNTKILDDLFCQTISPIDIQRQKRFESQLILTGYTEEYQKIIDSLSYEAKKQELMSSSVNMDRIFIHQRAQLDKIIKQLNTEDFVQMDKDLMILRHFVDFCHYSFIQFLQLFDSNFVPADFSYKPKYVSVTASRAVNMLEDLYFQIFGLKISTVTADQIRALLQLKNGTEVSESEFAPYESSLKKINFVLARVLSPEKLRAIIRLLKNDPLYEPQVANYSGSPRQEFAQAFQTKFETEEKRIKSEIQENLISTEVSELFETIPMELIDGYNTETNELLQKNTNLSLTWILPFRILVTFLKNFVSSGVKSLLNDLVIEGFFSNPAYKSNFSATVYAIINSDDAIKSFEESFGSDKKNSIAVMEGYIHDSHKDKDFIKKLEKMVDSANNEAHELLQTNCTQLYTLYKSLTELLADAKKPSSEIVSNLKVLMLSSRNRENSNLLEEQFPKWKNFFSIMKNYVIIANSEI